MNKFLNNTKPPLVAMIAAKTTEDAIYQITNSLYDGADAFGIQLCQLKQECRTREELIKIFDACIGKPIYITSYKGAESKEHTYEMCAELLLLAVDAGATLLDVPGDFFDTSPSGMTLSPDAVAKQVSLIDEIHARGGEVLMSCHHTERLSEDEILMHAREQVKRGADIIKIVARCYNEDQVVENVNVIHKIRKEIDKPLLYLTNGDNKYARILRQIGPSFGVCMYLCVQHHTPGMTKMQLGLRSAKQLRDNLIF